MATASVFTTPNRGRVEDRSNRSLASNHPSPVIDGLTDPDVTSNVGRHRGRRKPLINNNFVHSDDEDEHRQKHRSHRKRSFILLSELKAMKTLMTLECEERELELKMLKLKIVKLRRQLQPTNGSTYERLQQPSQTAHLIAPDSSSSLCTDDHNVIMIATEQPGCPTAHTSPLAQTDKYIRLELEKLEAEFSMKLDALYPEDD